MDKLTYEQRVLDMADRLAKAGNSPYMDNMFLEEAEESIAAQAEAIKEAMIFQYLRMGGRESDVPIFIAETVTDFLLENGYIPSPENAAGISSEQ